MCSINNDICVIHALLLTAESKYGSTYCYLSGPAVWFFSDDSINSNRLSETQH